MIVYLDTCSIQRPFDDQSQLRIALEAEAVLGIIDLVEQENLDLLSSEVLVIETENNPYPTRRQFAFAILDLASRKLETTPQIESTARTYDEQGIRPFDALHLACAVEGGADVLCTTDDDFHRRGQEMDTGDLLVLTPIELVNEIES